MNRSPIQQHTSAIIKGFIAESDALKNLDNKVLKGRLRELFTINILSKFLTNQFSIGTGVIINQRGCQSKEIDIIIYDNRILPPFIREQKIGVFPAECVVAVIEVRSWISRYTIKENAEYADKLYRKIYNPNDNLYSNPESPLYTKSFKKNKPLYNLIGLYDKNVFGNKNEKYIRNWMNKNARPLFGVCLVNKFSWLDVSKPEGSLKMVDENNEETKAFVAVLLDNIRTTSQKVYLSLGGHVDWLGIYTRDQTGIKQFFEEHH